MPAREFANVEADLRPMSAWLRETCQALGAEPAVVADAELCANELFANLCAYAFPEGGRHRIAMSLAAVPGGVELVVEDDGVPFDPVTAPLQPVVTDLSEVRRGGHGLLLVHRLSHSMRYERLGDRNRLTVVFAPPEVGDRGR